MAKVGKHLCAAVGVGAFLLPASVSANTPEASSTDSSTAAVATQVVAGTRSSNRVAEIPRPESHATIYSGYYGVDAGFSDRLVGGAFVDLYPGATGFHADMVYVDREENAAYGAFGLSRAIAGLGRLKLMVGTSTGNQNILPELSLHAGLEVRPAKGLILRPGVTYRRFRHGGSHVAPDLQLAYYFGGSRDGFFVAQADAGLTVTNTGKTGWSLSGGLTNVRSNGLRLGFAARTGYMAYDTLFGSEIRSRFYGGGPTVAYRFLGGQELFVRSDYTHNKHYSVTGAIVGLKIPL